MNLVLGKVRTREAILALYIILERMLNTDEKTYTILIDLEKTFDRIEIGS